MLNVLLDVGMPKEEAERALEATNYRSVEEAMDR